MKRSIDGLVVASLILGFTVLSGCGSKDAGADTNLVEMNASDGTMNDMTIVESAVLDRAGSEVANGIEAGNASNAM
jgi:hypothetical protein